VRCDQRHDRGVELLAERKPLGRVGRQAVKLASDAGGIRVEAMLFKRERRQLQRQLDLARLLAAKGLAAVDQVAPVALLA
jgi:hypothetical protein